MNDDAADSGAIGTRWIDRIAVISVQVDLDMLGAPQLSEVLRRALSEGPSALVVDLTKVEFMASAGIAALVEAQEHASATTRFAVVAEGPATSRPLRLLGLDEFLSLHPTLDDALRGLT
jgi:anti-sigma B factor antagonist